MWHGSRAGLLRIALTGALALLPTSLLPSASGDDEPSLAVEVQTAIRYADEKNVAGLTGIAEVGPFDPWIVADELLAAGRPDVARALAEVVRSPDDRIALLRQIARERPGDPQGYRAVFDSSWAPAGTPPERQATALLPLLPPGRYERDLATILDARVAAEFADVAAQVFDSFEGVRGAFAQGIRIARPLGWSLLELRLTSDLAAWAWGQRRLPDVRPDLDAVMPLVRGREDWLDMADVLLAYGALLYETGAHAEAERYLQGAAVSYARSQQRNEQARALSVLGAVLLERGSVAEALQAQLDAGAVVAGEPAPDQGALDSIQNGTAAVYESLGMLPEAEGLLGGLMARLLAMPRADPWDLAVCRGNLGRVRFLRGEVEAARRDFEACEVAFRDLGRTADALASLVLQGWCPGGTEEERQVRERLEAALAPGSSQVPELGRVDLEEALARVDLRAGRPRDAIVALERAMKLLPKIDKRHTQQVDVVGQYGAALVAGGRLAEALPLLDRYLEKLLEQVDGLEVASSRTYRGIVAADAIAAGIRAARQEKDLDRLWHYMEFARAIRLLASLGGRSLVEGSVVDAEVKASLQAASQAVLAAEQDLARAVSGGAYGAALAPRRAARDAAELRRDQVAQQLKHKVELADLKELGPAPDVITLDGLRTALDAGEVVVSLSGAIPGDSIEALVVSSNAPPRAVTLPGRTSMAEAVKALRHWKAWIAAAEATPDGQPRPPTLQAQLARLGEFLAPLQIPASASRVLVVPDGELAYIPFAAIWPDRDVALLPCGSLYRHLAQRGARRSGTRALALGITDYTSSGLLAVDDTLLAKLTPTPVRGGGMRWRRLDKAVEEAKHVAGVDGVLLKNGEVTSARLLELLSSPEAPVWTTIHFACHGFVNADHPRLSGLALADGLWTAQEIFSLHLKTDMVVLSACNTATDPYVMGEGLSGLVRAFLQTGTPRVIASLWEVPDEATAALMKHFYDALRADAETRPSTALRNAQAKVRETWPSPEYWAAWTLWGAP